MSNYDKNQGKKKAMNSKKSNMRASDAPKLPYYL